MNKLASEISGFVNVSKDITAYEVENLINSEFITISDDDRRLIRFKHPITREILSFDKYDELYHIAAHTCDISNPADNGICYCGSCMSSSKVSNMIKSIRKLNIQPKEQLTLF